MSRYLNPPKLGVHPSYKGGYTVEVEGYIYEFCPTHPNCNQWGYVPQHRLIAEDRLGRLLTAKEVVHHRDSNSLNNDPENLQVMSSQREHIQLHARQRAEEQKARLTEDMVSQALQGRSLKQAAALLGVHTQTLRNRFPELVAPRKRKSPTIIDNPAVIETIRRLAPDPLIGYREIARQHGIAEMTVKRICDRNGIVWVKKTKKGEKHKQYRRKTATPVA